MEQPSTPTPVEQAPTSIPVVDDTTLTPDQYEATLSAREQARLASRPNIDHLPDAIARDEGGNWVLLAKPGEKIIIEKFYTYLEGRPWRETKTYEVEHIDGATGQITLHDPEFLRMEITNIVQALAAGQRFKLPAAKMSNLTLKRKRGRPRKNPIVPAPPKAAMAPTTEAPAKRGRGRPKGSKNRPKDVIVAEKATKKSVKKAKAKGRKVKGRTTKG